MELYAVIYWKGHEKKPYIGGLFIYGKYVVLFEEFEGIVCCESQGLVFFQVVGITLTYASSNSTDEVMLPCGVWRDICSLFCLSG